MAALYVVKRADGLYKRKTVYGEYWVKNIHEATLYKRHCDAANSRNWANRIACRSWKQHNEILAKLKEEGKLCEVVTVDVFCMELK